MFSTTKQEDRPIGKFITDNICLKRYIEKDNQVIWTEKMQNDAFGTLSFQGFGRNSSYAQYVKVSAVDDSGGTGNRSDDDKNMVDNVIKLMLEKQYWGLKEPKLIISVTGGAQSFDIKPKLRESFKRGLMNAAASSEAWIVTGGTKTGVMEIVGEAAKEYCVQNGLTNKIVVLGIATWGIVANKERLTNKEGCFPCDYYFTDTEGQGPIALLDPNHNYFVLVDDGRKKFGAEISTRTAIESEIRKKDKTNLIPVVLLVVEGGDGTITTVDQAIKNTIPVVVIDGSGRAADFIAFAHKHRIDGAVDDNVLKKKAEEIFPQTWSNEEEEEKAIKTIAEHVESVKKIVEDDNLLTIIKSGEESSDNIDQAIINALIKANQSSIKKQLDLALTWNRYDVARDQIFSGGNSSNWKRYDFSELMYQALLSSSIKIDDKTEDKAEFITLFLDHGLVLKNFLTVERLHSLYKETLKSKKSSIIRLIDSLIHDVTGKGDNEEICGSDLLQSIGRLINKLSGDQRENLYAEKKYTVKKELPVAAVNNNNIGEIIGVLIDDYPERELFIWALLFNRRKLAEIFWELGQDPISGALTASMLLQSLSEEAERNDELDLAQTLSDNSQEFQQLAIGVLNECYQKDKPKSHELLVRKLKQWDNKTLFLLAEAGEQMDFIEHTCCQTKLNKFWKGKMALFTPIWQIILGIFLPFMLKIIKFTDDPDFNGDEHDDQPQDRKPNNKKGCCKSCTSLCKETIFAKMFRRFWDFHTSPITKFICHAISYVIFLGVFSYFMLTNLEPYDPSIPGYYPSIAEYVVYAWVFTLTVEEIRQLLNSEPISMKKKLYFYINSSWNRFDVVIISLFIISVILRWTLPVDQFVWARMFYSITLSLYYIRFLQFFYVEKNIGPKVVMISQMIVDMLFFLMLLAVFLLAYGVAQQALLYPNEIKTWNVLLGVVYQPYFSIYGDFDLQELQGDLPGCSNNATVYENNPDILRCPENSWLVMVLFSIYLILTNILLINLLIAMFSYTFSNVQDNSAKVWRFYRYGLIKEYLFKPTLAPPLIFLNQIFRFIGKILRRCGQESAFRKNFRESFSIKEDNDEKLAEFERSGMKRYNLNKRKNGLENQEYKSGAIVQRFEDQPTTSVNRTSDLALRQLEDKVENVKTQVENVKTQLEQKMESQQENLYKKLSDLDKKISNIVRMLNEQPGPRTINVRSNSNQGIRRAPHQPQTTDFHSNDASDA